MDEGKSSATLCGAMAAIFWSVAVAGGRLLTESLGGLTAVALVHTIAGMIALAYLMLNRQARCSLLRNPPAYTFCCGALFLFYILAFYNALALASGPGKVVVVGIINYLWPGLSLAFSIPLLGNRTSWPALIVSNAIALAGVVICLLSFNAISGGSVFVLSGTDMTAYSLALAGAISWGLYNNLSRRWASGNNGSAVPLFIICTALVASPVLFSGLKGVSFSAEVLTWLLVIAIFPTFLAYFLWDIAERRGHHAAVNTLAYAIPALSTLLTGKFLGIAIPAAVWLGCFLVMGGAVLSRLVIRERTQEKEQGLEFALLSTVRDNLRRLGA